MAKWSLGASRHSGAGFADAAVIRVDHSFCKVPCDLLAAEHSHLTV